jgi:hypothetical protein
MLKIPYGESNFKTVMLDNYFYQDRSMYINDLEQEASKFIFFLRPRRFGKSLFVSMLHYYYDLRHKKDFESIFKNLEIGKNPTSRANSYMVLSFEFSRIDTKTDKSTYEGFLSNVKSGVSLFLKTYETYFTEETHQIILSNEKPNEILKALFNQYKQLNITNDLPKIYIIIDEYDHFANEILSFNYDFFSKSVATNGFVRKFYEAIKTATFDGVVDRFFATGVSPVTLDSMTSGFNISTNTSLFSLFNEMMGFTEAEVKGILKQIGIKKSEFSKAVIDLRTWYNGYLFSTKSKQRVYNPDMVLYFAQKFQLEKAYPTELLDPNIATDYGKISKLFQIQNRENDNFAALKTLTEDGCIAAELTQQFSFERDFSQDDLISLLFYMGFLTIKEEDLGSYVFTFPNFVIQRLYAQYFVNMLRRQAELRTDNTSLSAALREMGKFGNPTKFFKEVEIILKALSNRDAQRFDELSLKAIFVSLLYQQSYFYVHSEYEAQRKYVDVFLEGIKGHPVVYEIAFELKYVKKSKKINLEEELDQAETQLMNYLETKKFLQRKNVKAFVVLVHGTDVFSREINIL